MGGGQSLTIGLKNLDRFAWIGGFSSLPPRGDVDGQFAALLQNVPAANERLKLLWIGCGKEDFLLRAQRAVSRVADGEAGQPSLSTHRRWARLDDVAPVPGGIPAAVVSVRDHGTNRTYRSYGDL